jgi:Fe2+ transport system protein FeoA
VRYILRTILRIAAMTPPRRTAARRATDLASGESGVVAAVEGPVETVERLAAMGLVPGCALRVVRGGSPMTVAVGDARLALGRGWSDALLVIPA